VAEDAVWHGATDVRLDVMVRYRMRPVPATVRFRDTRLECVFDAPADAVAPGQSLVCYREDVVVGGGTIACAS